MHHALLGEQVLERLPRGAHVLIMTHDHAEDFALCDAALRLPQPLGSIGLIGSSAKWTRFRRNLLAEAGHDPAAIDRITCPIGLPEITGKEPAVIAVAVAACAAADLPVRGIVRRTAGSRRSTLDVTLYRAPPSSTRRATRSPDDPAAALGADDDGALLVRDGVIVARGSFARAARRAPGRAGRPTCAAGCCCPGSSTPTCTTRRSGRSAGWACRCWTGWSGARCPRRASWPTGPTPGRWPRSSSDGLLASGRPRRWCSARTSPRRWTCCSPRPSGAGLNITAGLVLSDRILRPDLLHSPETRAGGEPRPDRALARPGPAALRGHAAVLVRTTRV